jgi:hypothetical protein
MVGPWIRLPYAAAAAAKGDRMSEDRMPTRITLLPKDREAQFKTEITDLAAFSLAISVFRCQLN